MIVEELCTCCNCGMLFEENDAIFDEEPRGEYLGQKCWEKIWVSPCCHDEFEEYREETQLWKCEDCGKVWDNEDLDVEIECGCGCEKIIIRRCPDCLGDVKPYVE